MKIRSLIFAPVAVLSVLFGVMAFASVAAQAAGRSEIGSFGNYGTEPGLVFEEPVSIAVDQSSGDVYVYDVGEEGYLYKFNGKGEEATFSSTGAHEIGEVEGAFGGKSQIAVDNFERSGQRRHLYRDR